LRPALLETELAAMAVRSVFVQFEHATFPVWTETDGRVTDRDGPLDLPIGASLREDFRR
jgi:hypothetical protein